MCSCPLCSINRLCTRGSLSCLWTADRRVSAVVSVSDDWWCCRAGLVRWSPRRPSWRARLCRIGGEPIVYYIIIMHYTLYYGIPLGVSTAHIPRDTRGDTAGGGRLLTYVFRARACTTEHRRIKSKKRGSAQRSAGGEDDWLWSLASCVNYNS